MTSTSVAVPAAASLVYDATYRVPLVSQDMRAAESAYQTVAQLEVFERVVTDLFSRVASRVASERSRLETLASRLGDAQAKVQKLYGTTKATVVLSPSKFPGADDLPTPPPIFPLLHAPAEPAGARSRGAPSLSDVPHGVSPLEEMDPVMAGEQDAMLFSETRETTAELLRKGAAATGGGAAEGLGKLPEYVSSVSGLLLFNTSESPYKKICGAFNNLENWWTGRPAMMVAPQDETPAALVAAPGTLVQGDTLPTQARTEFGFRPEAGQRPTINAPPVLPMLPGVADLQYGAQSQTIAPSEALKPFDLSVSAGAGISTTAAGVTAQVSTMPVQQAPLLLPSQQQPSIRPVPPKLPVSSITSVPITPGEAQGSGQSQEPDTPTTPSGDSRGDLLAAIRAGRKLNPVGNRKNTDEDQSGGEVEGKGGDEPENDNSKAKSNKPISMIGELTKILEARRRVTQRSDDEGDEVAASRKERRHRDKQRRVRTGRAPASVAEEDSGPSGASDGEWADD